MKSNPKSNKNKVVPRRIINKKPHPKSNKNKLVPKRPHPKSNKNKLVPRRIINNSKNMVTFKIKENKIKSQFQ